MQAVGGNIQSTCSDIKPHHLGTCDRFEERQIGGERFNFFEGCPRAKTCTLVLRGGAEQFIAEVERSLHDAIMIVKRAIRNNSIVAGGGACEVSSLQQIFPTLFCLYLYSFTLCSLNISTSLSSSLSLSLLHPRVPCIHAFILSLPLQYDLAFPISPMHCTQSNLT